MPVITVWGLPQHLKSESLNDLNRRLVNAVLGVEELGLTAEKDVTCLFPADMVKHRSGTEIIVQVSGLFSTAERTDEVRQCLANALGEAVEDWWYPAGLNDPELIEVFIHPFEQRQGFWCSHQARAEKNRTLHIECVTGVIQVVLALKNMESGKSIGLGELSRIGSAGKSEKAGMYIFEFIKDGIVNLKPDSIEKIANGDYVWVWEMTNHYLKHFGHEEVEPVPITI
jgi:hypothetical protein